MNAETIAVGSEMLTPHRQDTNSLYLTDKLNELGVEVRFKSVVGDNSDDLTAAAKLAMRRSDIIILIGGLGPTEDDLTREAVAEALGLKLQRDPELLVKLEERFAKRGIKMSANNAKQADVLTGATVLANPNGSAPGQWISGKYDGKERILILLPGPPNELKGLFEGECIARLRTRVPPQHIAIRELKIALMPESQVDARLAPIYKTFSDVQTTILAGAGEIQLHLRCRKESQAEAEARVEELAEKIDEEMGDAIDPGRSRVLHRRTTRPTHHCPKRKFALLSGRRCRLLERTENAIRQCPQDADQATRSSQPRSSQGTGRRHPAALCLELRSRNHGSGRSHRGHRAEAGGPGVRGARRRGRNTGRGTQLSRRPQAYPLVCNAASAGDDQARVVVRCTPGRYGYLNERVAQPST